MTWLDSPLAADMAHALFHFVWEGTLIAALLGLMLLVLRRAPAQARYAAACAAMLAMAGCFAVTAIGPGTAAVHFPVPAFAAFAVSAVAPESAPAGRSVAPAGGWAVALWLAGVLILLIRRAGGWLAARRLLARAAVTAGEPWHALMNRLCRRMGIGRAVGLVESALVDTPAVLGWLRPVVLVPAGWFLGLPAEQAEAILFHELAHIRRHDYLVNLLQSVVEDLLFYHPAVWWVGRVMRREREHCCDDAVIALGGDRRAYARTLAALEGLRAGESALAATGGSLAGRIRRLLRPPEGPRASAAPLLVVLALVCAGAAALPAWQSPAGAPAPAAPPVAAAEPTAAPDPPPAPQAAPMPPTPYRKWMTEDVAYIITDEERGAFRRLTTGEEREHFIEQFWLRRDPTPGTPRNEFKEEHYRRIAYANQLFSTSIPGWKTDRGLIYILYGPPDEKESHPSGDAGHAPFEEWRYRKLEGIGEQVTVRFVDPQRDGNFHLEGPANILPQIVKPPRLPPAAVVLVPRVQPNGDYIYRAGDASVRVGTGGAVLITVPAEEVRVTLTRITRQGSGVPEAAYGGGEVVLRETARVPGVGYTKLVTLEPGAYQLETESDASLATVRELQERLTSLATLQEELKSAHEAYTDSHPQILALQARLRELQATRERQGKQPAGNARIYFRVP